MSDPSSTSSSDKRTQSGRETGTLVWVVVLLVLIRGAFALWGPEWRDRPELANAREFLAQSRNEDIRVMVFGSSRMQAAFMTAEWARHAGLKESQVVNLSVDSGQFWDARYMVREAGGLPGSVGLVLIEAARWNFNRNKLSFFGQYRYDYPENFRQQGSVFDRWVVDDWVDRAGLLFEYAWPLYHRRTIEGWIETISTSQVPVPVLPPHSVHWNKKMHSRLRNNRNLMASVIVLSHFNNPAVSSFARRNFTKLVRAARSGGAEVALVTLPTREPYLEGILKSPQKSDFSDSIDALIESETGDGVYVVGCKLARDCGLNDEIFVDYGHLNRDGARAITEVLYERIRELRRRN